MAVPPATPITRRCSVDTSGGGVAALCTACGTEAVASTGRSVAPLPDHVRAGRHCEDDPEAGQEREESPEQTVGRRDVAG